MNGMTQPKVKVAVSLSADLVEQLRAAVTSGKARSVSAFVEHAVRAQFAAEIEFDAMLADMLAVTGGAPTDEERAAAARLLGTDAA
jgi:Arc/MetJ-type ribon-helix-helix transcriptional regulator